MKINKKIGIILILIIFIMIIFFTTWHIKSYITLPVLKVHTKESKVIMPKWLEGNVSIREGKRGWGSMMILTYLPPTYDYDQLTENAILEVDPKEKIYLDFSTNPTQGLSINGIDCEVEEYSSDSEVIFLFDDLRRGIKPWIMIKLEYLKEKHARTIPKYIIAPKVSGTYIYKIDAEWDQGWLSFVFKVEVKDDKGMVME